MKNINRVKIVCSIMIILIIAFSTCYVSFSTSFFHDLQQTTKTNGSINAEESDKDSISTAIVSESVKIRAGIDTSLSVNVNYLQGVEFRTYFISIYAILFKIASFHSFTFFVFIETICIIYLVVMLIIHFLHQKDGKKSKMVHLYA